jgi:uncharacterized protein (DUF2062 family)
LVNRSKHKIEIDTVPKDNLIGIVRKLYERFIRIRGNPREVALGLALGVFVGMTPTMGVQMPIAIFFAACCKWSKLSAAIGVWISNPLTAPLIYGVTYITGAKLMSMDPMFNMPLSPAWSALKVLLQKAPQAFGAMTVGGAIIGLPLAIISYYLSYAAVEKYQKDVKAKLVRQKNKLANTKEKMKKKVLDRKIQKGGNGGQGTEVVEVGMRTAECGSRNAEVGKSRQRAKSIAHREKTECRGQMSEGRGQRTEDRGQKTEDR